MSRERCSLNETLRLMISKSCIWQHMWDLFVSKDNVVVAVAYQRII